MKILQRKEGGLLAIAMILCVVIMGAFAGYKGYSYIQQLNTRMETTTRQLEEREEENIKLNQKLDDMQNTESLLREKLEEKLDTERRYERTVDKMVSRGFDRRRAVINANKIYVYNFLQDKGMTDVAIAGIMGNIEQESKFDTYADNGAHRGICQWDYGQRWSRLESSSSNPDDIRSQCDYMWQEINERGLVDRLNESPDVYSATKVFDDRFEGSGGSELGQRVSFANNIYQAIAA